MTTLFNPFTRPAPAHWGVPYVEACGVEDRLKMVREMDAPTLERLLAEGWRWQLTVVKAAERRLRKLRRLRPLPPLTNCCNASFAWPGHPDIDLCSRCGEHAAPISTGGAS